jgi:hypothetical protein
MANRESISIIKTAVIVVMKKTTDESTTDLLAPLDIGAT